MNDKTQDQDELKKNAVKLFHSAKELVKGSFDQFKQSQGGVLIPKQVKYPDYQQVPEHVAADPVIAPVASKWKSKFYAELDAAEATGMPLNYKKIAYQIKDKQFTTDKTGGAMLKDGTYLPMQLLSSPSFIANLKAATVQLTVEQMEKEKQEKYGPMPAPPPPDKVSESEKAIIEALGMTEEQYLNWINKVEDKTGIQQLYPGKVFHLDDVKEKEKFIAAVQKPPAVTQAEKYLKYAEAYSQKVVQEHSNKQILETIVAGVLLSANTFKMDGDHFIVPRTVIKEVNQSLHLDITYDQRTESYRVGLK
jgi:hypothetical protein